MTAPAMSGIGRRLAGLVPRIERNAVFVMPIGARLTTPTGRTGLRIAPVDRGNVRDILAYRGGAIVRVFETFLEDGDAGVYAYEGNEAVGHAWASLWHGRNRRIWGYLPVREGDAAINFCSVKPECRGRKIYQNMLVGLVDLLLRRADVRAVAISCSTDNHPSFAAIEKVGFRCMQVVTCLRWAGMTFTIPRVRGFEAASREGAAHE